ncbi:hypothetical protein OIDMADRAFT_61897 [Oidiodendron maius Zn]|uniref:Uncharacterized protein n=1 Tax=Oidiodendron maius (strain Zn) TaxID=913774 RepID=A0A0C3GAB3_OIDMZ|nr:hypothetical protein OIDMADRAFT_61897 [Oidiodendron maius Zn]
MSSSYHDPTKHRSSPESASRKRPRDSIENDIITSAQERSLYLAEFRLESAKREIQTQEETIGELNTLVELYVKENMTLQHQISILAATRSDGSLLERYISLEKKHNTCIANTPFKGLTGTSREWFSSTKINDWWSDVHHGIQQAGLAIKDIGTWRSKPSCENKELRRLISKCLGRDLDQDKMGEASSRLSKLRPTSVLQALNTASVICWVLETDLPEFGGQSELLASYQDHIAAEVGNIALRNLDLAARRRFIRTKAFQEQIPGTAKKLSVRLSNILAPLFAEHSRQEEKDWDQFATWGDDNSLWEDRRGHSIEMFTAALKMKADLQLNIEDYEPIIYPPGTLFDKNTMRLDWADSMQGSAPQGRKIALCIEPAIFIRQREAIDNGCPISDVLIPNNFCGKRGKRLPGPVVKARVVI